MKNYIYEASGIQFNSNGFILTCGNILLMVDAIVSNYLDFMIGNHINIEVGVQTINSTTYCYTGIK